MPFFFTIARRDIFISISSRLVRFPISISSSSCFHLRFHARRPSPISDRSHSPPPASISDFTQGDHPDFCISISARFAANMSNIEAINLSGDEGAVEISNSTVAAKGNTQRKVKPNTGITKRRQRKLTSPIWDYFTILDDTDAKGNLKKVLAFTIMPPPHTGAALAEKIYGLLKEWGIHSKVISLTLDNAFSNDAMVDCLKFDLDLIGDASLQPEVEELCKKVVKMDVNVVDDNDGEKASDISSAQ
ncbi:hypothetical protein LXL04_021456 [Taraxacum kok-saghyz]